MAGHWTDLFSFTTGAVRRRDVGYLVLSEDKLRRKKIPHSGFVVWQAGKWFDCGEGDWNTTSAIVIRRPKEQLVVLGEFGAMMFVGSGDQHQEIIAAPDSSVEDRGPLRCVRLIGERLYVVGMDRQVYRRDGLNKWSAIDEGARPTGKSDDVVGFETVDGFSEKEIYAAGWEGEIWFYNASKWRQLHSPTNLILTSLCCGGELAYACGQTGLVLEGRKDKWRVIEQDVTEDDIWGLAWYNGALYLSTMSAVYRLQKGKFELVEMGEDEPKTCYHLSAADGILWSIGSKDVMAFDGKKWTRID